MSAGRGRILVIRGGAIGDFILTLPAIAALRAQFPDAHLEVLGYPHIAQLALAGGLVDAVRPIEARELAGFFARNGALAAHLQAYFGSFNIIISYLYDPDDIFRTNVARCTKAQFIIGPHRPVEDEAVHATDVFLRPLERLAIFGAATQPRLVLKSRVTDGNCVALHPGSGSEHKNWPETNWAQLLDALVSETDFNLLLVGGEAEGDRLERLSAKLPVRRCEILRSLPLAELAVRLNGSAAFIGHDSGITHLAAALGVPCVALWAGTPEQVWRPQGDRVILLKESSGIENLEARCVMSELMRVMSC